MDKPSTENRVLAVFSYLTIYVLIFVLIFKRDDKFLLNHANQALTAAIFAIGFSITVFIGWPLLIPLLVFVILNIIGAAKGEEKRMPIIGGINIVKPKDQNQK